MAGFTSTRDARRTREPAATSTPLDAEPVRLRAILENLFDLIVELDARDLRPLYFSPSHLQTIGYRPEELLEIPAFSLSHPDERELQMTALSQLLSTGDPKTMTARIRHRDGSYRWLESVGTVYATPAGEQRILFVSKDITERLRIERELRSAQDELESRVAERTRELRDSQRLFETLAETTAVGIVRTDPDGRVLYLNQRMHELAGHSPEQTRGLGWIRAIHPDDREDVLRAWTSGIERMGAPEQSEHRLLHPDGTVVWVWAQGTPEHDENGAVSGYVVTMTEITERVRAERERERLEERSHHQQRLESLGVLARGIAHDFNNLLSVVLGHARLAASQVDPDGPVAASLGAIRAAAQHATGIADEMLTYSGEAAPEIVPLDLGRLVGEMGELLRASVSAKCRLEIAPGYVQQSDRLAIEADAVQIRQVVLNLVSNASEALGDEPGRVTLRCGRTLASTHDFDDAVATDLLEPGEYVYLEVEDSGAGMDRETVQRIFEPYFTTKFSGRGLGLAAVLGIVRSHRGVLQVASRPGAGTRMRLLLPLAERDVPESVTPVPEAVRAPASGRVLFADDEDALIELGCTFLARAGFEVEGALGGEEALRILRERADAFDAAVIDLAMPDRSGAEVLKVLREIRPELPVVLVSGYREETATREFEADGFAAFLHKPYEPEELVATLRDAIE